MQLHLTSDLVVAEVALRSVLVRVQLLAQQVDPRLHSSDVDPLTVQVATVPVSAVGRDALFRTGLAQVVGGVALCTLCVLETEGGLVSLSHLLSCLWVDQVEVDKGLERVVVVVAVVEDPVIAVQVREEGAQAPVVCEALELQ